MIRILRQEWESRIEAESRESVRKDFDPDEAGIVKENEKRDRQWKWKQAKREVEVENVKLDWKWKWKI